MPGRGYRPEDANAHLAAIVASSSDAIISCDRNGTILSWNPAAERVFGYAAEEAIGRPVLTLAPEHCAQEQRQQFERVRRGEPVSVEAVRSRKDGTTFIASISVAPMRKPDGTIIGVSAIIRDITDQRRTEANLRASHQRFRHVTDNLPALIGYVDQEQRYRFNNRAYETWMGRAPGELLGMTVREAVGEETYEIARPNIEAALAGEQVAVEWWLNLQEPRYLRSEYIPERQPDGTVIGFYLLASDLTERKRAEDAVRESEARFRTLADSAPALIWMTDEEGRVTFANMHYEHMFGRPAADMLDGGWTDIVLPEDLDRHTRTFFEAFSARTAFHCQTRVIDKTGQVRWLRCEGVPRLDDAQRFLGYTGCNVDVTDTKVAEEHLRIVVGELNHRVKNTLATVQSIVAQSLRTSSDVKDAQSAIESRLLALSRVHDVLTSENWEGAWIGDVVSTAIKPFISGSEARIHCRGSEIRLPPRTALGLAMALQELATNAVKYGGLSNETGEVHLSWLIDHTGSEPFLFLRWEEKGGPLVVAPSRRGFGSRLIERSLAQELGGQVTIDFAPAGVVCTVEAPLEIQEPSGQARSPK